MGHPSIVALIRFLRLAQPDVPVARDDVERLKKVIAACLVCERFGNNPRRIRVATPLEIVFNLCVALDFVKLSTLWVLSVVCLGTAFCAAEIVSGRTAREAFAAFHRCWICTYVGAPQYAVIDQESSLQSSEFVQYCAEVGTTVVDKAIEAHWSFGSGERFHAALRDVWYKTVLDARNLDLRARNLLALCVFSLNATPDSIGRASSLVVFGQVPRPLPARLPDDVMWPLLPNHERLALQAVAREAAEIAMNGARLREVRKRAQPDEKFPGSPGQLCYLYRESANVKDGRPGFVGPFIFLWRDGSICWVLVNSRPRQFPATHLPAAPASEKLYAPDAVQLGREIEIFPRITGAPPPDPVVDMLFTTFWNTGDQPGDEAVAEPGVDADSLATENIREGEAFELSGKVRHLREK